MLASLGDVASAHFWWIAVIALLVGIVAETLRPGSETGFPAFRWAGNFVLYAACVALAAIVTTAASLGTLTPFTGFNPFAVVQQFGGDLSLLILGILAIDLFVYLLHRLEHSVFVFWRFHSVHHSDAELDASTALRHHPMEYAATAAVVSVVFALLGLPVWVLAVYGPLFFVSAVFQHLNVMLPHRLEHTIQLGLVCPDMHRVHHSANPDHYNSNFGSVFSIWDRAFCTYRTIPDTERDRVVFGLGSSLNGWAEVWRPWMQPFMMRRSVTERPSPMAESVACSTSDLARMSHANLGVTNHLRWILTREGRLK